VTNALNANGLQSYALPSAHHFNSIVNRRAPDMAIQHRLGILSQRRFGFDLVNRVACCLTSLEQLGQTRQFAVHTNHYLKSAETCSRQVFSKIAAAVPRLTSALSSELFPVPAKDDAGVEIVQIL